MKFAFFGAGAVGGYFGARMARAGKDVVLIARGEHLEAMTRDGLRVESFEGDFEVHPEVTGDPASAEGVDVVVLAVKSQHTMDALEQMAPMVGEHTVVLSIQNGVENEERISARYGPERTLGGVSYVGSQVNSPGVILHTNLGRIALGRWPSGTSSRVEDIAREFEDAGIRAYIEEDIATVKWRKLVWNAAFNPLSAVFGRTSSELSSNPWTREVLAGVMGEVVRVANASGHRLDEEIIERSLTKTSAGPPAKTSMLQDLEAGRALELDALLGVVVRKGAGAGIPTPVSKTVLALARAAEEKSMGKFR